jgi:hypothetical protein
LYGDLGSPYRTIGNFTVIKNQGGQLEIFGYQGAGPHVRNLTSVYHGWQLEPGGSDWHAWVDLTSSDRFVISAWHDDHSGTGSGFLLGPPAVTLNGNGGVTVFARALDRDDSGIHKLVFTSWSTGTSWSPWKVVGDSLHYPTSWVAGLNVNGEVEVFAWGQMLFPRGIYGTRFWRNRQGRSGGDFLGWEEVVPLGPRPDEVQGNSPTVFRRTRGPHVGQLELFGISRDRDPAELGRVLQLVPA